MCINLEITSVNQPQPAEQTPWLIRTMVLSHIPNDHWTPVNFLRARRVRWSNRPISQPNIILIIFRLCPAVHGTLSDRTKLPTYVAGAPKCPPPSPAKRCSDVVPPIVDQVLVERWIRRRRWEGGTGWTGWMEPGDDWCKNNNLGGWPIQERGGPA